MGYVCYAAQIALAVLTIVAWWKVHAKAGVPGWTSLIPILNIYVLVRMGGLAGKTVLLYFIPVVNILFSVYVVLRLVRAFGKGTGFAIGVLLLPFLFMPILAFGPAEYEGARFW